MNTRIVELRAENFKRLKAVRIKPTGPVTAVVGKNGAGKTSVLDALAAALGGGNQSPEMPIRRGADGAVVVADLGDIIVTRKWESGKKGSTLTVSTKDGAKYSSPQAMLDKLVGELSFDPLAFERMKPAEQAAQFAKLAGIDLAKYTAERRIAFDNRTAANKLHREHTARLAGMPEVEAPDEPVSIDALIAELQEGRKVNAEADKAQQAVANQQAKVRDIQDRKGRQKTEIERIRKLLTTAEFEYTELCKIESDIRDDAKTIVRAAQDAKRVDLSEIETKMRDAEGINAKVRAKQERQSLVARVGAMADEASRLAKQIEAIDVTHEAAVAAAALPIPGLAFNADGVMLNGIPFEQCSGAEKLRTSVAVGLALNPKLKLMLIRDGSLLDENGMQLLAEMAEKADAQILIERVDNGKEIGVHIVDGETVEQSITAA